MSVREYIGARYVPVFADPLDWDATSTYEPLTVVLYQGNSYTSRQAVPANIPITNTTYWAQTGNYNAQIEQYRAEVATFNDRINSIEDDLPSANFDSTNTVKKYIDDSVSDVTDIIPSANFDSTNTVKKYIDDSVSDVKDIIPSANFDSTNTVKKYIDNRTKKKKVICFGDSYGVEISGRGCWTKQLNDVVGKDYTIYNYCVAGAAFTDAGGNPISDQLTPARTAHPNDDVSEIIVICGYNDGFRGTLSSATTGATNFVASLNAYWPSARIIYGFNWYNEYVNTSKNVLIQAIFEKAENCVIIDGLWNATVGMDSTLFPSALSGHPTPAGMQPICNLILAALYGGNARPVRSIEPTSIFSDVATTKNKIKIDGSMVYVSFTASSITAGTPTLSTEFRNYIPYANNYICGVGNQGTPAYVKLSGITGASEIVCPSGGATGVVFNGILLDIPN